MTWMPIEWARAHIPEPANPSASTIPVGLRSHGFGAAFGVYCLPVGDNCSRGLAPKRVDLDGV